MGGAVRFGQPREGPVEESAGLRGRQASECPAGVPERWEWSAMRREVKFFAFEYTRPDDRRGQGVQL